MGLINNYFPLSHGFDRKEQTSKPRAIIKHLDFHPDIIQDQ